MSRTANWPSPPGCAATHPPQLVSAALARRGCGSGRWRSSARRTPHGCTSRRDGVEQSTRASVAAYRAGRFAGTSATSAPGAGRPAGRAAAGRPVLRDRRRRDRARPRRYRGAGRGPRPADVRRSRARTPRRWGWPTSSRSAARTSGDADVSGYDAVFVDPARRGGRGRIFDPEAYSPPLSWAVEVARAGLARGAEGRAGHPARGRPGGRRGRVDLGRRGREGGGALVRCRGRDSPGSALERPCCPGAALAARRAACPTRPPVRSAATCTSPTAPSSARIWSPRSRRSWTAA